MADKTKRVKLPNGYSLFDGNQATSVAQQAIKQVADAEKAPVKKNVLQKIVQGAGKVLSNPATQTLVSLIPGIGPAAGALMAKVGTAMSGNDDEWFSEYTCAGATFNEMLGLHPEQIFNDSTYSYDMYHMSGCVANIPTSIFKVDGYYGFTNVDAIDGIFSQSGTAAADPDCGLKYWKEQLLPTIMADVRRKTGNVLNATEDEYWKAFVCDAWLYAIYYEGKKYLELTKNLPLNIPNLTKLYSVVSPKYVAQFEGIISTLGDYLRSTVKLPYAFTEYIRWRFGTMFKSSNTERPGLISYDILPPYGNYMNKVKDTAAGTPVPFSMELAFPGRTFAGSEHVDDAAVIDVWSTAIEVLKAAVYKTGRANADIKLAYDDAQIRYDINISMFDAKENNLRCNMYQNNYSDVERDIKPSVALLMDGRLNAPAALQNITMSTSGAVRLSYDESETFCVPPFPVFVPVISLYLIGNIAGTYQDHALTPGLHDITLFDGWLVSQVKYGYDSHAFSTLSLNDTIGSGFSVNYNNRRDITGYETETVANADAALTYGTITGICALAARSLEFHNQRTVIQLVNYNSGNGADFVNIGGYTLAYDTALVSLSQVDAIQRTAMRNLIRAGYTHKTPEGQREEIKEARNDILEGVISEI